MGPHPCDALAACNAAQRMKFGLPPGDDVRGWLLTLRTTMGDPNVAEVLIDGAGMPANACEAAQSCTAVEGVRNHLNWPDGVGDMSGRDWEVEMLRFLGSHRR